MKNLLLFLLIACIAGSCRRKNEEPVPSVYPELQITAIHFPGIPDKDVSIDRQKWIIHVKMPSVLTVTNLTPTVELSEEAQLAHPTTLTNLGGLALWSYPNANNLSIRIKSKINPNKQIGYTIQPTASAPLKITQSKPIAQYAIGDSSEIIIEVRNAFGNKLPKAVLFINKRTGVEHSLSTVYITSLQNTLRVFAYPIPFELGDYDIRFKMEDNVLLDVNQPLTIIPGQRSYLENSYYSLEGQPGGKVKARGGNLFKGLVSFRLLYPNGTVLPLNADYNLNGTTADLAIPASLQPGYYGIEVVRSGIPLGRTYRLSIVRNEFQPSIFSINEYPLPNYPTEAPLIVQRSRNVPILFTVRKSINRYVASLVSESNAASAFQFTLTLPVEAAPYFIIPSTVPAGRYKAFIQEIDPVTKEVVQQSEPYERTVVLQ